jgi:hypothetical protein
LVVVVEWGGVVCVCVGPIHFFPNREHWSPPPPDSLTPGRTKIVLTAYIRSKN